MKTLRKLLLGLALLAGGVVVLLVVAYGIVLAANLHDRPPSGAALRFAAAYRDRPPVADTENGFVYATGFGVKPGDDPQAAGLRSIATRSQRAYDYKSVRPPVIRQISDACREGTSECLAALERDARVLDEWSTSERWLFERYVTLISRTGWRDNVSLDPLLVFPPYSMIMDGQKLLFVQAWARAGENDAAAVRNLLSQDGRFWRHTLESSNVLITKMIAVAALKRHFEVGNLVLRRLRADTEAAGRPLEWEAQITIPERSMQRAWVGEWVFFRNVLADTMSHGRWSDSEDDGIFSRLGQRATIPLLQPQDLTNQWAEMFTDAVAQLDVPYEQYRAGAERAEAIFVGPERGALSALHPYNPIGSILRRMTGPGYTGYSRRVVDLEGIRRGAVLASQLRARKISAAQVPAELSASAIRQPYDGTPFGWNSKHDALTFTGLEPLPRGLHEFIY